MLWNRYSHRTTYFQPFRRKKKSGLFTYFEIVIVCIANERFKIDEWSDMIWDIQ